MSNVTVFCFLASYVVAFGLEIVRWARQVSINRIVVLVAAAAGMVAHTIYLSNRSGQTGMPPLLSSTHDWMLVLAWLVVASYLFLTAVDRKLPLGVFLLPLVILLIVMAYFVSDSPNPMAHFQLGALTRVERALDRAEALDAGSRTTLADETTSSAAPGSIDDLDAG